VLGDAGLVAFAASRDLEVAGRFYGEVLGFRLLEPSTFSNAYHAKGTQLRVTLVDRVVRAGPLHGARMARLGHRRDDSGAS
jgi:catechol 2,3-dioxygenase-like lactoylglutathione lyase family enzyme